MRVLVVSDIVGGVRTFTRELAGALAERGVELHLALIGRGGDGAAGMTLPGAASVQVRDLALEWMEAPWDDVERTAEWVEELRALHRPDVIHMNTFTPVRDPEVPVLLTVHSCVLTWWRAVHGHDAPSSWDRYRELAAAALGRADAVVAPTRALLEELESVHGTLPGASVIANGRAVGGGRSVVAGERERLVVSVGRLWDRAKNARALAAAAPLIDGRVALIGPGHVDGGEIELLHVLGESGVIAWLSRAAVFAEPARYEPFGLAALEAALCGCALVLGDIPSLREVWGEAAVFVSPSDSVELARSVGALLEDPRRRREAASRALEVARRYTPRAMADAYLSRYRRLARVPVSA